MANGKFLSVAVLVLVAISLIPVIASQLANRDDTFDIGYENFSANNVTRQTLDFDDLVTGTVVVENQTGTSVGSGNYTVRLYEGDIIMTTGEFAGQTLRVNYTYRIDGYIDSGSMAGVIIALFVGFVVIGFLVLVLRKQGTIGKIR